MCLNVGLGRSDLWRSDGIYSVPLYFVLCFLVSYSICLEILTILRGGGWQMKELPEVWSAVLAGWAAGFPLKWQTRSVGYVVEVAGIHRLGGVPNVRGIRRNASTSV